jgi:hypothetical protein
MEADWSVALSAVDPFITVPWTAGAASGCRFIDLRIDERLVDEIEEARTRPALRSALLLLNHSESPLWTARCDAWTTSVEQGDEPLDPYEMDAEPGHTNCGAGSYVDVLLRTAAWVSFDWQERWLREITKRLRTIASRGTRVELVLRPAEVDGASGFGVTWFAEGAGATPEEAANNWAKALTLSLAVLMDTRFNDGTMEETGE